MHLLPCWAFVSAGIKDILRCKSFQKELGLCFESVSCSVMSNSSQPCGLKPARLLCPWDFPGKNTGVGCHFLLQRIFPTQGSNPGLLHCRQILYHLSHLRSPGLCFITALLFDCLFSVPAFLCFLKIFHYQDLFKGKHYNQA